MEKKPQTLKIGTHTLGAGKPVYIIAEAGVNHNGDIKLAKKLIDAAKTAGADAVKFQTFIPEELVTVAGKMADYQTRNTGKKDSQLSMLQKLALSDDEFRILATYAKQKGIVFLSTAHDGFHSVDLLASIGVPAFKFGSADTNNLPVLAHAARYGKPLLLSTGMSDMTEIKEAVKTIRKENNKIVVFQCTTDYPARLEDTNLRAMNTMRDELSVVVGYSDHTLGTQASIMAVTLGASILEKHITLDNNLPGPDHKASLNPTAFKEYVEAIRNVETILGSSRKSIVSSAKKYIPLVKKSLVARTAIRKGEKFTKANVAIKRPANGLVPKYFNVVIGKTARRDIRPDETIRATDYGRS